MTEYKQDYSKVGLRDTILYNLYKLPKKDLENNTNELSLENIKRYGYNLDKEVDIIFHIECNHGNIYSYSTAIGHTSSAKHIDLLIHSSLEDQFSTLQKEYDDLDKETSKLQFYFRKVFNECETIKDVRLVIPNCLEKYTEINSSLVYFRSDTTITLEEAQEIKKPLKEYEEIIERRILTNLLYK